ncbi:MAG: SurA N-terminal domain-containing protein [Thermodesulfobacteriota bacterium]
MLRGLKAAIVVSGLLTVFFSVSSTAETLDRIVATVNGQIITLRDLNERLTPLVRAIKNQGQPVDMESLKRKALDLMIDQRLILDEARRRGVEVTDEQVAQAIEKIITENKLDQAQFEAKLTENGQTMAQFRQNVRAEIARQRLVEREIASRVVISDEEVYSYLRSRNPGLASSSGTTSAGKSGSSPRRVHLRNILLPFTSSSTESEVKNVVVKAEKVRDEIGRGLDFAKAAVQYSAAGNARQGGDLGFLNWEDIDGRIRAGLQGLKEGEVSPPIPTGQGIQLFQIVALEGGSTGKKATKSEPASDIRVSAEEREQVRTMLMEKRLKDNYESWTRNLRSKAVIKINL